MNEKALRGDWLDNVLAHSFKGTNWDNHKYVAKKNGRYIYPEDLKKTTKPAVSSAVQFTSQNRQNGRSYKGNTGLFAPLRNNRERINRAREHIRERHINWAQQGYNNALARNDHEAMGRYSQRLNELSRPVNINARDVGNSIAKALIPDRITNTIGRLGDAGNRYWQQVGEREEEIRNTPRELTPEQRVMQDNLYREDLELWERRKAASEREVEQRHRNAENMASTMNRLLNLSKSFNNNPIGTINQVASRLQYAYDIGDPVAIAEAEEEYNYINSLAR